MKEAFSSGARFARPQRPAEAEASPETRAANLAIARECDVGFDVGALNPRQWEMLYADGIAREVLA